MFWPIADVTISMSGRRWGHALAVLHEPAAGRRRSRLPNALLTALDHLIGLFFLPCQPRLCFLSALEALRCSQRDLCTRPSSRCVLAARPSAVALFHPCHVACVRRGALGSLHGALGASGSGQGLPDTASSCRPAQAAPSTAVTSGGAAGSGHLGWRPMVAAASTTLATSAQPARSALLSPRLAGPARKARC